MNKILEPLFLEWLESCKDSPKTDKAYDVFCTGNDIKERNEKSDILSESMGDERRAAFSAGFNTAVKLLVGGSEV